MVSRVDHVTIYRWVQRFMPLLTEAARPCRHAIGDRWQVDESYVKVAGQWRYVYRAVDQLGQVVDVFVSRQRDATASHRFFQRAMGATRSIRSKSPLIRRRWYPAVLEERLPAAWHRTVRYANNRIECDHGRLKARLRPMRASSRTAVPGWSSPGMRWCRIFGVDTMSWPSRSRPKATGGRIRRTDLGDLIPSGRGDVSLPWAGATQQCRLHNHR